MGYDAAQSINAPGRQVKRPSAPIRGLDSHYILIFANKLFSLPFDKLRTNGSKVLTVSLCAQRAPGFALYERKTKHKKDRKYHSAEGKEAFAISALRV